jgi:pSer/pThr/pTyr-binding forkhead associated (FHA) protein
MARLLIKTEGLKQQALELRLGVNRVGRSPESDFPIHHPTVSTNHCELVVSNDGVLLRDCNSTNGTFVNGEPVGEARLVPGQTVSLGSVDLLVENTQVAVAIPQFERERPKPPVVLDDGSILCPRHMTAAATFKCTYCKEVMCEGCVHVMKRKGGPSLFLCPLCSHKCEPIQILKATRKKTFLGYLQDTVRLKFKHFAGSEKSEK